MFDTSADSKLNAILSIVRTTFICLLLTVGALLFSKDANDLVISPTEKMSNKVERISRNPIEAA